MLHIAFALDSRGRLAGEPKLRSIGLPGDAEFPLADAISELADEVEATIGRLDPKAAMDDEAVSSAVSRRLKKACQRIWDRRPIVETTVLRI